MSVIVSDEHARDSHVGCRDDRLTRHVPWHGFSFRFELLCEVSPETAIIPTFGTHVSRRWDGLTVLPIAPLLAAAIKQVFEDGSVTSMFDGAA